MIEKGGGVVHDKTFSKSIAYTCTFKDHLQPQWTLLRFQRDLIVPKNFGKDNLVNLGRGNPNFLCLVCNDPVLCENVRKIQSSFAL